MIAPRIKSSKTVMVEKACRRSGTWEIPCLTILSGPRLVIDRPSKRTSPDLAGRTPEIAFKRVVLPAPLRPDDSHDLALPHLQGDIPQGSYATSEVNESKWAQDTGTSSGPQPLRVSRSKRAGLRAELSAHSAQRVPWLAQAISQQDGRTAERAPRMPSVLSL